MKDLIVLAVITFLVSLAVWKILRDKKRGSACSGCSGCPVSGECEVPFDKRP